MKTLIFILSLLVFQNSYAQIDRKGNGGDAVVQEFIVSGTQVFNFIIRRPDLSKNLNYDLNKLFSDFRKISVQTADQLFLNGTEVDAINYPIKKEVQVSRKRWLQISADPSAVRLKRSLALHEYLWVLGIDDSNYIISAPILGELDKEIEILQPTISSRAMLNALCTAVRARDLQTVRAVLQFKLNLNHVCESDLGLWHNNVLIDLLLGSSKKYSTEDLSILEALLTSGANPNTIYSNGYWGSPLLSELIKRGALDAITIMVKYGADPNMYFNSFHSQRTALFEGAAWGAESISASMLGWLIDQGADVMKPVIVDNGWDIVGAQNPACEIAGYKGRTDLVQIMQQKVGFDLSSCKTLPLR